MSEESKVVYNWTENEDDKLKRTLADTITGCGKVDFPEPLVVYLYDQNQ